MPQVVDAIYENGVLRPMVRLNLQEHQHVRVTVESTVPEAMSQEEDAPADPLADIRVSTGILDLAEHFDDYRFGTRRP